jgi:hypothetical protein
LMADLQALWPQTGVPFSKNGQVLHHLRHAHTHLAWSKQHHALQHHPLALQLTFQVCLHLVSCRQAVVFACTHINTSAMSQTPC